MEQYKIIRKIGDGFFGNIYLIKIKNKKYVLKRQKILKKDTKKNLKLLIWREIEFSEFVNKLPKNKRGFFMEMYEYKVIKCNINMKFDYGINDSKLKKLNESKYCLDIIYEYKNKTIYNLLKKNTISLKEKYSFLIQILYALDIMKKNGYTHNDLHALNITYEKYDNIKIRNYNIKSKYKYSLIDYGFINNKKYKKINMTNIILNNYTCFYK